MNSEDEWETDEEQTEYLRLSIENSSKIKKMLNKSKLYHTKIIKRLDQKEIQSAQQIHQYINESVLTNSKVTNDSITNTPYYTLGDTNFVVENRPEIGSNIIIEQSYNNKDIKVLGVAERYLEATVIKRKKRPAMTKPKEPRIVIPKPPAVPIPKTPSNTSNSIIEGGKTLLGKKRRRRSKRNYIKDSTVIEVRKR